MATDMAALVRGRGTGRRRRAMAEQALGLLEAALEVADGAHHAEIDPEVDERLGDLRRQPGDDRAGAHEAGRLDRLDQMVGDRDVDGRDAGDVDHYDSRAMLLDRTEQLLGEL